MSESNEDVKNEEVSKEQESSLKSGTVEIPEEIKQEVFKSLEKMVEKEEKRIRNRKIAYYIGVTFDVLIAIRALYHVWQKDYPMATYCWALLAATRTFR